MFWPAGYERVTLDETDSTMAEARRRAEAGLERPTWIMARRQTAGRGRRGRSWAAGHGNLAATLVFRPYCTPAEGVRRSFLAANALFEALAIYVERSCLSLKWPNDVLLNDGKVAGILLESSGSGPFLDWLSIGIGVNLKTVPEGINDAAFGPVSLLGEGGDDVSADTFLSVLASSYATQEAKLEKFGFARIREDWLRHAARLGDVITARTSKDDIRGVFDTVDEDGNLVLITGTGPKTIPAADIYF